ncbi:MAG: cyanophycin synthetase [Arcicella sp.]|nr:cyanophycin synthetase [Arcicella sp.]
MRILLLLWLLASILACHLPWQIWRFRSITPTIIALRLSKKGTNSILLDAYNANPSSMSASIQEFYKPKGFDKQKVVILGDMLRTWR